MPHDVFISYSSIDKTAAFAACATFEAARIRCWIAPRDVAAGAEWAEEIIDAIEAAKIMVLIFSSHSNESRQVKREIELAVSRGLTIMPIRLEKIAPTKSMAYYMAGVHWLEALTPPLETHFKKMVEWINPHLTDRPRTEPAMDREQEVRAHFLAGRKLSEAGRNDEALAEFEAALKLAEGREEEGIRETVARIMFDKAEAHNRLDQRVEAVEAYNWLVERYSEDVDGVGRELCARAMLVKGHMKGAWGYEDMAILDYDMYLAFYADDADQQVHSAEAMVEIGASHAAKGRAHKAVAAYDAMLTRFRGATDPAISAFVAKAMMNRAAQLGLMGQSTEANAGFQAVIDTFAGSANGDVQAQVANARRWKM